MEWKKPKNTDKYYWTQHVVEKMYFYGLSEQKVLSVIRRPKRVETGIAENTVAVMVPVGNIKKKNTKSQWSKPFFASDEALEGQEWSQEIWVMYQIKRKKQKSKIKITNQNSKIKKLENLINPNKQLIIISAWRYPGVSPKNNPIPEEILREIEEAGIIK